MVTNSQYMIGVHSLYTLGFSKHLVNRHHIIQKESDTVVSGVFGTQYMPLLHESWIPKHRLLKESHHKLSPQER